MSILRINYREPLNMLESSLVTYKDQIIQLKKGTSSQVDFDFEMIRYFIKREENFEPEHLHFFHLHPFSEIFYSHQDEKCVKALGIAFGFPVNFWILTVNKTTNYKNFSQYIFENNEMRLSKVFNICSEKDIPVSPHCISFGVIEKLLSLMGEE